MENEQKVYSYDNKGNVEYEGFAPPGTPHGAAYWRVKKYIRDSSGRVLEELWANGDSEFRMSWSERSIPTINYDRKRRFGNAKQPD